MIRCNLSVILAEQKLKISKVAQDTGLSRTTITALAMNYAQGIQFDTLNKLCVYLRTTPNELISFLPIDVKLKRIEFRGGWNRGRINEDCDITIWLEVSDRGYSAVDCIECEMDVRRYEESLSIMINIWENIPADDDDKVEYEKFVKVIRKLTRPFMADLEESIRQYILEDVIDEIPDVSCDIYWDNMFIGY